MMEYGFLVQTCDLPAANAPGECRAEMIAEKLAGLNETLQRSLASFQAGGWRIVSHDLLQTNESLVITFVIGREARPQQPLS